MDKYIFQLKNGFNKLITIINHNDFNKKPCKSEVIMVGAKGFEPLTPWV